MTFNLVNFQQYISMRVTVVVMCRCLHIISALHWSIFTNLKSILSDSETRPEREHGIFLIITENS